eukprot:snap_masked-scaffold_19-processed-gene-0.22-mRNA-1 protein AED:1.00 eAED:1.00 QI:0/0/0/0/1/1/2/0/413
MNLNPKKYFTKFYIFLGVCWFGKLFGNGFLRMLYTFSSFLVEDFELERKEFAQALAIGEIAGGAGVFFTPFGDIVGARRITLLFFSLCTACTGLFSLIDEASLLIGLTTAYTTGYSVYSTSIQSLAMNQTVDVKMKGTVTSILESSWSCSMLVFVPLMSILYSSSGYTSVMYWILPDEKLTTAEDSRFKISDLSRLATPGFFWFNLQAALFALPHNGIFTAFAFWVNDEFDVSVDELGASVFILGASEILGVIAVSLAIKRLMKYNLIQYKKILYQLVYVTSAVYTTFIGFLPLCNNYALALFILFVMYMAGEFVIVITLAEVESYCTPKLRTSALGMHLMSMFVGRSIGAVLGERLYSLDDSITPVVLLVAPSAFFSICALYLAKRSITLETEDLIHEIKTEEVKETAVNIS